MDIFLLIIRLLLVLVFSIAGLAKLMDRAGSYKAVVDFGVPPQPAKTFALMLPLAELVVASLLIFSTTTRIGAIGTFSLLMLLIGVMTYKLAKGRKPDCHCFGLP